MAVIGTITYRNTQGAHGPCIEAVPTSNDPRDNYRFKKTSGDHEIVLVNQTDQPVLNIHVGDGDQAEYFVPVVSYDAARPLQIRNSVECLKLDPHIAGDDTDHPLAIHHNPKPCPHSVMAEEEAPGGGDVSIRSAHTEIIIEC